jgi:hypothetical protein
VCAERGKTGRCPGRVAAPPAGSTRCRVVCPGSPRCVVSLGEGRGSGEGEGSDDGGGVVGFGERDQGCICPRSVPINAAHAQPLNVCRPLIVLRTLILLRTLTVRRPLAVRRPLTLVVSPPDPAAGCHGCARQPADAAVRLQRFRGRWHARSDSACSATRAAPPGRRAAPATGARPRAGNAFGATHLGHVSRETARLHSELGLLPFPSTSDGSLFHVKHCSTTTSRTHPVRLHDFPLRHALVVPPRPGLELEECNFRRLPALPPTDRCPRIPTPSHSRFDAPPARTTAAVREVRLCARSCSDDRRGPPRSDSMRGPPRSDNRSGPLDRACSGPTRNDRSPTRRS